MECANKCNDTINLNEKKYKYDIDLSDILNIKTIRKYELKYKSNSDNNEITIDDNYIMIKIPVDDGFNNILKLYIFKEIGNEKKYISIIFNNSPGKVIMETNDNNFPVSTNDKNDICDDKNDIADNDIYMDDTDIYYTDDEDSTNHVK